MTPEQFVYWLQGFSEISGAAPTAAQWQVIQDHLAIVFDKRTPQRQLDLAFPKEVTPSPDFPPFHKSIKWPEHPIITC